MYSTSAKFLSYSASRVSPIGLPKCVFTISKIEFLGHNLSSSGCSPLGKHTSVLSSFPPPSDKPALQRFLCRLNLCRKSRMQL